MKGVGTTAVYRMAAVLIWGLAIWHSWLSRGLFADGSATLLHMMQNGGYALFWYSRQTLNAVTQAPAAIALWLGVTDTHLLARLLSAGLFFAPTAYYHACLFRARRDPALLGAVVLAIAVVFVPTSFFIIGEYNLVLPAVLFVVLVASTAERPTTGDAAMVIATALLLLRSYETVLAFGLLLAGLIAWRLRLWGVRGGVARLYALAALLFLAAAALSLYGLVSPHAEGHLHDTLVGIGLFWTNLQFVLPLFALLVVAVTGLFAPAEFAGRRLYLLAGSLLALAALSPLLWLTDGTMRPLPESHYHSRMVASLVLAAIALAIWLYSLRPTWTPQALPALGPSQNGRRLMLFAFAALMAALPADLLLSALWQRSLVTFQATIAARSGLITFDETPLSRAPWHHFVEVWALSSESLVLRRAPTDGIVVPPHGFTRWQFFDATRSSSRSVDRFRWAGGA